MGQIIWETISESIEREIRDGRLKPGDRLPTELELVSQYNVGRHSVRRAVSHLAKKGLLSAQQGRGTFVSNTPNIVYELGQRQRLKDDLASQGVASRTELVDSLTMPAPAQVAEALGLPTGAPVDVTRTLTFANDVPIAYGSIYHEEKRFPGFAERRGVFGSVTETYRTYGINEYQRDETTVFSRQANEEEARLLRQHAEWSVMILSSVDTLPDGTRISYAETAWAAARVRFKISNPVG